MIHYLNSDMQTELACIGYMSGVVAKFHDRMQKGDWNKESKKNVAMAATYLDKAYISLCGQLDAKQGKTLINKLNSWKKAKLDIIRPTLSPQKEVVMRMIEQDDLFDIIEHCLTGPCKTCEKCGQAVDDCEIRTIFIKYDVPIDNVETPAGKCPYKY